MTPIPESGDLAGRGGGGADEPEAIDTSSARALADAIEDVGRQLGLQLDAWPGEVTKLESWTGRRREDFDAEVRMLLAEAGHCPETLQSLAARLRRWADAQPAG